MATKNKSTANATGVLVSSTTTEGRATLALLPSVNAATVIEAYQGNVLGKDADMNTLMDGLRDTFKEVKDGDLHTIEAMLISQATALQTIFTSLARRANNQEHLGHYQAFLGLALKAQSQCRATLSALVDLKFPRQATFVKQANIANGPQQVNNGADSYAQENQNQQTELLEDQSHGSTKMDSRAAPAAVRGNPAVETVGAVHRAAKRRR